MKKLICIVVLLSLFVQTHVLAAMRVELDGIDILTTADTTPLIVAGRTLMPLRNLAVALGGEVSYDEVSRTAIVNFASLELLFPLDRKVMYKNGIPEQIDVAAQAINGRAFIPARYLAEAVGAEVSWDNYTQTVIIRTPTLKRELIACYAIDSASQFQAFGQYVHRAMLQWAKLELREGQVVLTPTLPLGYEIVAAKWAPERNVELSLQVICDDLRTLIPLLEGAPESWEQLGQEIVNMTLELGFSGVSLDLESITQSRLQTALTQFVSTVARLAAQEGLHTSIYVPAKLSDGDYGAYNYPDLAASVDQLIVMAHDYVVAKDKPAPPAPLWWVEKVLQYALRSGVPKDKLILGISLYGLNWPKAGGSGIYQGMLIHSEEWLAERGLSEIPFDISAGMGYAEYVSPAGEERILWAETLSSVAAKVELLEKYNIAGLSFWRFGGASPALFAVDGPFTHFKQP